MHMRGWEVFESIIVIHTCLVLKIVPIVINLKAYTLRRQAIPKSKLNIER